MRLRIRRWYYEWKCWFIFRHHMESMGSQGEGKWMYQCSFCWKQIMVRPFNKNKGAVTGVKELKQEKAYRRGA